MIRAKVLALGILLTAGFSITISAQAETKEKAPAESSKKAPAEPATKAAPEAKKAAPEAKKAAPEAKKAAPEAKQSAGKSGLPQVLDFSADWCVPCKKFKPTFDKVAKNYKDKIDFVHYDAEKGPGKPLADKYKVNILPTVMFMDAKGKVVSKFEGLMKEDELVKSTDALLK